jgi:hypothetical protein
MKLVAKSSRNAIADRIAASTKKTRRVFVCIALPLFGIRPGLFLSIIKSNAGNVGWFPRTALVGLSLESIATSLRKL